MSIFDFLIGLFKDKIKSKQDIEEIKSLFIFELENLEKKLVPNKERDNKVYFSETKKNEIINVRELHQTFIDSHLRNTRKYPKTVKFFHHYMSNTNQLISRVKGDKENQYGSLKKNTFNNLKNYLNEALKELKS